MNNTSQHAATEQHNPLASSQSSSTASASTASAQTQTLSFERLEQFLSKVPSIQSAGLIASGQDGEAWWFKFAIDIHHPLAWQTVQELGHVLNYLSAHERLPTQFLPVSPPPYMNGVAKDFLAWVIQCNHTQFSPDVVCDWLEARLPSPIDDVTQWQIQTDLSEIHELNRMNFADLDALIPSAH